MRLKKVWGFSGNITSFGKGWYEFLEVGYLCGVCLDFTEDLKMFEQGNMGKIGSLLWFFGALGRVWRDRYGFLDMGWSLGRLVWFFEALDRVWGDRYGFLDMKQSLGRSVWFFGDETSFGTLVQLSGYGGIIWGDWHGFFWSFG